MLPAIEHRLYTAAQARALDEAAQQAGIDAYTLMQRAGAAAFALLCQQWQQARSVVVVCGGGNNAGDGYVVARLALQAGWALTVLSVVEVTQLHRAAAQAYADFMAVPGAAVQAFDGSLPPADVMVDALLGTGLSRALAGQYAAAVTALNAQSQPVLALDIPSGLHSDTGQVCGSAVQATVTLSFIGWKVGLFIGKARAYTGELQLAKLEIAVAMYEAISPVATLLGTHTAKAHLPPRSRLAHKGHCGHALLIGGAPGMSGAVRLAGEAALRVGSGLVTVATHPDHANAINLLRPELMVSAVESPVQLRSLLPRMSAIGIGPGMGQTAWSRGLLTMVQTTSQPKVVDADALNLLAQIRLQRDDWVLTPHPGEASRLLGREVWSVEQNRLETAMALQTQYGGVVILKGAGTVVASAGRLTVCAAGNPGMASGGMGDALTGMITGLLAQGLDTIAAAETGVWLHAHAADVAARVGERGLLASDVIASVREVIHSCS